MRTSAQGSRGGAETLVLSVALTAAAVIGLGAAWWMAQPDRTLTQFERLGSEIGCVCGTCPNRPIATCGCAYADGMLDELQAAIAAGQTDGEIMTALATRYGTAIRIRPASTGFDFVAWAAPIMLLTVGAVAVGAVVLRLTRRKADAGDDTSEVAPASPVAPADEARLRALVEREIERLDP